MKGTVAEDTVVERPFVERFLNENMVVEGSVNKKVEVD